MTQISLDDLDFEAMYAREDRIEAARERYEQSPSLSTRFAYIKAAWAEYMPLVEAGDRIDPYFIEWEFTPIEEEAWNSIRRIGLPMYPQIPVAGFFLDFGDPFRKIGVELDGKQFHDAERDLIRDTKLATLGWRIFRITGREAKTRKHMNPFERMACCGCTFERGDRQFYRELAEWAYNTEEGVFWALRDVFYRRRSRDGQERAIAFNTLEEHAGTSLALCDDDIELEALDT